MLMSEEKKNNIDFSEKNLFRMATPSNIPNTEESNHIYPPETKHYSPEHLFPSPIILNKKSFKFSLDAINEKSNNGRTDINGNLICKHGKQKISFIDKITNNKFVEIINVESFKEYNKMEEVSHFSNKNNCCIII